MNYVPLIRNNPTDADLTIGSSQWLSSRLMVGKGTSTSNSKICVPSFNLVNNISMRIIDNSDMMDSNLLGIQVSNNTIQNYENVASTIVWQGCWTSSENPIIGKGHSSYGLVCPFNTFNVGFRYKRGWRPSRVD